MGLSDGGDFFENNFDAAGDWNGDNGADEAKGIDANDDSGEDDGGGEALGVALELGGNEIVFDLSVDDVEDEEDDGGDWGAEENDE